MKATHQCAFNRVAIGATFCKNGNAYIKRSTRTAFLTKYNRIFYFGQRELVTVDKATCDAILRAEA